MKMYLEPKINVNFQTFLSLLDQNILIVKYFDMPQNFAYT